jgi:hypothetical protein
VPASRYDWHGFLTRWNAGLLACRDLADELPEEAVRSGWLGFPPTTEEQIARTEARLGTALPPSYRQFLLLTNGWCQTGFFIRRVWSTEQVEWHRTRWQEGIDAFIGGAHATGPLPPVPDEEYLVYGDAQTVATFRAEYLQTALEVSDWWDGAVYLLNPQTVTAEGEWEAWFFGSWPDGIRRFRSFWNLMNEEYSRFLLLWDEEP